MPERFTETMRAASEAGWSHAVQHRHVPDVNGLSGAHAACSRKVSLPSEPADDARRRRRRQAHTVARKSAEMPDAHGVFGLQMPRASSTIPTPAITISEAAPAPAQKPAAQSSV